MCSSLVSYNIWFDSRTIAAAFIKDGSVAAKKYTYDYTLNNNIIYKYRSRLDRIYYKGQIEQSGFTLFGNDTQLPLSDHYGIQLDFTLKK